jgi:hypothetical protein
MGAGGTERGRCSARWRAFLFLDRSWAQRLGAMRIAGIYRIRSRDLARRLALEALWVDASGAVHAYGARPAATSAISASGANRNHPEGVPVKGTSYC